MKAPSPLRPKRKAGNASGFRSARQFPWTKEEDALLGRLTDREVAGKLNRTLSGVRDRRKLLGKPAVGSAPQPFRMEREPRDRYARLFAMKSNQELRAILGWSYKRIHTRRRQLTGGKVRKQQPEWTLEEDRLLGTKPDQVLARKFGRPVSSVRHRRWRKRIRLHLKPWRPEDDKILGTRTDHEIALLLGRGLSNVAWRRKKLGIRPKLAAAFKIVKAISSGASRRQPANTVNIKPGGSYCTWTAAEDALLGKFTDEEVARRLGYPVTRVRRRRHLLGLPNNNPNHRQWAKEEIALLGTRPDREVAPLVNRTLGNVRYKRLELGIPFHNPRYEIWKPAELALLGKLPDKEVARRTGHSLPSVRHARTKRHILSVRRAAPDWRPEEDALLGTAPDTEIAARLQRTIGAVKFRRSKKGIPAWHGSCAF